MIITDRLAALGRSLALAAAVLVVTAAPALASDPPPIGSPIDRFESRHPIGVEGIASLGDGVPGNGLNANALNLRRLFVKREAVTPEQPNPPVVNPPELTSAESKYSLQALDSGPAGIGSADLDLITGDDGEPRGSLEPGLLLAGHGIGSTGCPATLAGDTDFCLTWLRPRYDATHTFSNFLPGERFGVRFGNFNEPKAGTDIALATGTFDDAEGPSVVAAWVHEPTPGNPEVRVAHFIAQRNRAGRVQSLVRDGAVQTLGPVFSDPTYGLTSPALAVGDFAGNGADQVAVTWAAPRVVGTQPRFSATLLEAGPGAGLQQRIAPQTLNAATTPGTLPQVSPGAAAQHDSRGVAEIDHLIVGPGMLGVPFLYRLDVSGGSFASQKLTGGHADPVYKYPTFNSDLESLGDLDGDGLDELLSTASAQINDSADTNDPASGHFDITSVLCVTISLRCGRIEVLDFASTATGFRVDSSLSLPGEIETAVVDARPTRDQRIAPAPDKVDVASLPQVGVSWFNASDNQTKLRAVLNLVGIDDDEILQLPTNAVTPDLGPSFAGGLQDNIVLRRPPRLTGLPLDGEVELGDPVKNQYTSLEPSVVLNAPPTHFDILDGRAYDPNFCYAGNQYLVPPVCFFNSAYERKTSTKTDVTSESTEDWGVSAKVNVDADFGVAELGAEVRGGYGENFNEVDGSSATDTVTVNVKALNTDKIYAIRRTYDTLEYPLYQPGAASPQEYLLASTPHTVSKRWIDSSSPDAVDLGVNHQPGNILSYPEDLSTSENPFISPTEGSDALTKTTFGRDEFELSDSSDYEYTLSRERVDNDKAATTKRWNVGATLSGGGGLGDIVKVKAEVTGDYSDSDISTLETTIGDETSLTSKMAGIDESFGETAYIVKPFAYWTDNAALVLDYAVEPSMAPAGSPKTWWQQNYGVRPDLTLNLPRLLDYEEQAGISSDAARFISPGVSVLEGTCADPAPLGERYTRPGEPLCLRAQVENYSLKDGTTPTRVEFYDADPDLGGELIGHDDVPPVAARDFETAELDWVPDLDYAGTAPRIFAKVEAEDTVREIHEDNNKGFRSYIALPDPTPALHAAQDVYAELSDGNTLEVEWTEPRDLATHEWLVRAYPDDGGAPIDVTVAGDLTSASIPAVDPGRYRVVVFAVGGGNSSAASHPAEPVDVAAAAPGAPQNVVAAAGNTTIELGWNAPSFTGGVPIETYRIREYRGPGESFPQAPIDTTVAGSVNGLSLSGLMNDRPYRFTVQAINAAGPGELSAPSAAVTPTVAAGSQPSVAFVDAPAEGGYSGASVAVSFVASPAGAEMECIVDGQPRPCRSPLRLSGLTNGSHTIQVRASAGGGTASTPMVSWTVDDAAPTASLLPLKKLTRRDSQPLRYRGADEGGSELERYEVRIRRAGRRGEFSTDPLRLDRTAEPVSGGSVDVAPGQTVCVAVRSFDRAGNDSGWTEESCTTREIDESTLRREGSWKQVRGKSFSNGHALQAAGSGPALSYFLGRTSKVQVFAGRCRGCGSIAFQVNGHTRKVIDLGKTKRSRSAIATFSGKWIKRHEGRLRLISLGGGPVRIDGIAVWRTNE